MLLFPANSPPALAMASRGLHSCTRRQTRRLLPPSRLRRQSWPLVAFGRPATWLESDHHPFARFVAVRVNKHERMLDDVFLAGNYPFEAFQSAIKSGSHTPLGFRRFLSANRPAEEREAYTQKSGVLQIPVVEPCW